MSYRQTYYHIVFGTKNRKATLTEKYQELLYKYIWGIIKNKNCTLYRINGHVDHIHILSDLHASVSLADFVKDIKVSSSIWLKSHQEFNLFDSWSEGYAAFTISYKDTPRVVEYIKNQKIHHKKETFKEEYIRLLIEHGIKFDEKYI